MQLRLAALGALLVLGARPGAAYTLTGAHWYNAPITMQLQLGAAATPLSDGSPSWGAAAEDALSLWNNYLANERFAVVRDSTASIAQGNRVNNVFFSSSVYGDAWGSGVLAITLTYTTGTSQTTECDVLFNNTLSWDSYRGAQRYNGTTTTFDFHRVALHEFGHVLGLDHPDQAGQTVVAIMNSHITNLDSLATDDITGAQSLYGAAGGGAVTAPVITTQPASQTVASGSNVYFTVVASSPATMSYQWAKNGVAIGGATSATLLVPSVTTSSAGEYTATVSNSGGSTTSAAAHLTVTNPVTPTYAPVIVGQPTSRSASVGDTVSFSVVASGTSPFTYSWRKDGVAISGANQSTYTIGSARVSDAGSYTVVVSNAAGSATSSAAFLTIGSAPVITVQPAGGSVNVGGALTLSVTATSTPAPTYQWYKNGTPLSGATQSTLVLAAATPDDAGTYTVTVTNSSGTVASTGAVVAVNAPPAIATAPVGQTLAAGDKLVLSVAATGSPAPTYQWQKNSANISGATQSTLVIAAVGATDSGTYSVVITNAAGSVTTVPVLVTVNASQLVNLSTRGYVPPGGALTAGFVLRGSGDKSVLVRGIGPSLNTYGVNNYLTDPQLAVIAQDSAQTLAVNDSWSLTPQLSTEFQSVGAFALPTGSADSASEVRLAPGAYTTRITSDASGTAGVALAEVYDADASTRARLINLSTLGYTGSGDSTLVAGFSIRGTANKHVLIRAVGPGLAPYGVAGALSNPKLDVYPLGGTTALAGNDDWTDSAEMQAAVTAAGAFSLKSGSRDAALVLTLAPGGYTVTVSGVGVATGYVLVEVYDLDP